MTNSNDRHLDPIATPQPHHSPRDTDRRPATRIRLRNYTRIAYVIREPSPLVLTRATSHPWFQIPLSPGADLILSCVNPPAKYYSQTPHTYRLPPRTRQPPS